MTHRGLMLLAAGTAIVAAAAGPVSGQSSDIRGTVAFESGGAIPQGQLEVFVDDKSAQPATRGEAATVTIDSDGGATEIPFALPADASGSSNRQIVATLKREDGWLLARGSAKYEGGGPVAITLNTVMY